MGTRCTWLVCAIPGYRPDRWLAALSSSARHVRACRHRINPETGESCFDRKPQAWYSKAGRSCSSWWRPVCSILPRSRYGSTAEVPQWLHDQLLGLSEQGNLSPILLGLNFVDTKALNALQRRLQPVDGFCLRRGDIPFGYRGAKSEACVTLGPVRAPAFAQRGFSGVG